VFVLYATSSANAAAHKGNRKTITGGDVISAMSDMEFDKFVRPLENSLAIWKKSQKDKKDSVAAAKKKVSEEKKDDSSGKGVTEKDDDEPADEANGDQDNEKVDENKENTAESN